MRPEGTSYYLSQILAGTTPVAGNLLPSGTWAWNLDLFATEPRLISTDPQTPLCQSRVRHLLLANN